MKKIISLLIMLCLVMSLCSMSAFADEAPALPTATVTEIDGASEVPLTFALRFVADSFTPEQYDYYKDWYADFVLVSNREITLHAAIDLNNPVYASVADGADAYIAGQYGNYPWIPVPWANEVKIDNFTLNALNPKTLAPGEELGIMQYAVNALNIPGLMQTYKDIVNNVGTFNCGICFSDEFIKNNPGANVSISLRLYDPSRMGDPNYVGEQIGNVAGYTIPTPPPPPVPATADNSNMPLWGALFIAFAAVALLTGKKRRA